MSTVDIAREYAIDCHESTGHKYGNGQPYVVHLQMVVDIAEQFIELVPMSERDDVLAACWLHDVIEDCRQTYNDVKSKTNVIVADLVYALTTEKGKNRKERANERYYAGIRQTPNAAFIKICDRIANYKYSVDTESRMAKMYKNEMADFIVTLYDRRYDEMFKHLNSVPQCQSL